MALVLYAILSWICITFTITTTKKKEVVKGIIIYLFLTITFTVIYIDMFLNLMLISICSSKASYFAVLLHRNIVRPLLMISFTFKLNEEGSYLKKAALFIFILLLFIMLEFVNIKLQMYTYRFSIIPVIVSLLYIFIALALKRLLDFIELRGEGNK